MASIPCPHCGIPNAEDAAFCIKCGASLQEAAPPEPPSQAGQPPSAEPETDAETSADRPQDRPRPPSLFDLGFAAPVSPSPRPKKDEPGGKPAADPSPSPQPPGARADDIRADDARADGAVLAALTQLPGLLTPLEPERLGGTTQRRQQAAATGPVIGGDQALWMRRVFSQEPAVADELTAASPWPNLRLHWVFLVLAFAVGIPMLLNLRGPTGAVQVWPGVQAAHQTIAGLPSGADVLIYWAYDPATAAELDLVATPLIEHLVELQANVTIVSLLPTGPATAERLVAQAVPLVVPGPEANAVIRELVARNVYLSGGATVLPLVAQPTDTRAALLGTSAQMELVIVLADDALDVRAWLELVQPRDSTPVIAGVSAAADPVLRPYLDSGQLVGLVSGFDGAAAYRALMSRPRTATERATAAQQLVAQNWGQMAFLGLILLGNLLAFLLRSGESDDV